MKYVPLISLNTLTQSTKGDLFINQDRGGPQLSLYAQLPLDEKLLRKIKIKEENGKGEKTYLVYADAYIVGKGLLDQNDFKESKKDVLMHLANWYFSHAHYENNYKGLKIQLSGRIKGALRARKIVKKHGSLNLQCFSSSLLYHRKDIYTKWGILGLKVFINK